MAGEAGRYRLRTPTVPFLDAPTTVDPSAVATPYAFLGIPFGPPYESADLTVAAGGADAVRRVASEMQYGVAHFHHDFDLGGKLFPEGTPTVTDLGDVTADAGDPETIWDHGRSVVEALVARGVTPLAIGGLDAIPPIVVGGFSEPIHVLHVDAHIDFREEVNGQRRGYSSPIRRIREMSHVGRIVQIGLRSVGSGRPSDVEEALASGNELVTAWEIHEAGIGPVIDRLDEDGPWVVTIDCDGLDPSIAPGVGWPEPGGLTYPQIAGVVRHLARSGRIAAAIFTEFQPDRDIADRTAQTIIRLLIQVIGLQPRAASR
jgi:agmatinase